MSAGNRSHPVSAIAAALALALPAVAGAVSVEPRGTGQVLLFPYYTANGGNQTLLSVVNTTARVKALKVRFREGLNSKDVLDFLVYLAPYDTWTAAVSAAAATGPATLLTSDASCTVPRLVSGQPFRNFQYAFPPDHPGSLSATYASAERTREGHVEIIEMGELSPGTGPTQLAEEVSFADDATTPRNCASLIAAWAPGNGPWAIDGTRDIGIPTGGLAGSAAVVDVAQGVMVSYPAVALADFYTDSAAPGRLHTTAFDKPDLTSANNGGGVARADLSTDTLPFVSESFAAGGAFPDAVSLVLMRSALFNDFLADPALGGSSEWVVTFPTKTYYVNGAGVAQRPFSTNFNDDGRAAEDVVFAPINRDAVPADDGCGLVGVPPPGCGPYATLDFSVNVIELSRRTSATTTAIFGSTVGLSGRVFQPGIAENPTTAGWARLVLEEAGPAPRHYISAPSGLRYYGLPATGFSATRIINSAARPGLLANYAGAQPHRGKLDAGTPIPAGAREDSASR